MAQGDTDDPFAWVPDWLSNPPPPTPAAIRGANMLRSLGASKSAATAGELERLNDIWGLLKRAERLGWSLTMSPEEAGALANLLEKCRITKFCDDEVNTDA